MGLAALLALTSGPGGAAPAKRERGDGLLFATPDQYATFAKVRRHRAWLPRQVDLTGRFPKPRDQEWQGSCSAWASGYAARSFLASNDLGRAPTDDTEVPSPEYIYNRVRGPGKLCTDATSMRDSLNLLKNEGAVSLAQFPYNVRACSLIPPDPVSNNAARFRIRDWHAIEHETKDDYRTPLFIDDIKGALAQGLPVVFGWGSPNGFKDLPGGTTGIYRTDAPGGAGHAMAVVGYDDEKQAFRVINSYGTNWGDGGYLWIAYDTFKRLTREAYVLEPVGGAHFTPVHTPTPESVDAELAKLISAAPCSSIHLGRENGVRVLTGFAGGGPDFDALKVQVQRTDPGLVWRVDAHQWPQCEAELTLVDAARVAPVGLSVDGEGAVLSANGARELKEGRFFSVSASAPANLPVLQVFYIQADGSAAEVYRGAPAPDARGRRYVVLGAGGEKAMRFKVGAPLGDEVVIALAGARALIPEALRSGETEREFLSRLRAALAEAHGRGEAVAASLVRVHTS